MNLKNKFTLLIPTYNRYPYLLRILKYYKSFYFPFNIYVLDSSDDEIQSDELKQLLTEDSIYYQKYDSRILFANKIAMGCEYITTPYAALCGDDDFTVLSGIIDSINFLESNSDFSLAYGRYIIHTVNREKNKFKWEPGYVSDNSIIIENLIDRINYHMSNYSQTFYAIHRSDILKLIWRETIEYTSNPELSEIFPSVLSILYGKKKILNVFYSSRENNSYYPFDLSYYKVLYSEENVNLATIGLAKHIQQIENMNFNTANVLARKCLEQYTTPMFKKINERKSILYKLIKYVYNLPIFHYLLKSFRGRKPIKKLINIKNKIFYCVKLKSFGKEVMAIKEAVLKSNIDINILNRTRKTYIGFVKER